MVLGIVGLERAGFWSSSPVDFALTRVAKTSESLATLKQVNHGSDDPAGLIAAEQISLEMAGLDASDPLQQDAEVQLASALSAIQDADVAAETSHLAREKILAMVGIAANELAMKTRRTALDLFV